MTRLADKVVDYHSEHPYAEPPYWGTICALMCMTVPAWLLSAITFPLAMFVDTRWYGATAAFTAAALIVSFATFLTWRKDRATLRRNGWYEA